RRGCATQGNVELKLQPSTSIHASVGVIIAIIANTWVGRIVPPFIWGVLWCARIAVLPGGSSQAAGRRGTGAMYAAEYLKAVTGSLLPALVIGSLKALFRYAVIG